MCVFFCNLSDTGKDENYQRMSCINENFRENKRADQRNSIGLSMFASAFYMGDTLKAATYQKPSHIMIIEITHFSYA